MVLEGYRSHPERRRIQQYPIRGLLSRQAFPFETRSATKLSTLHVSPGIELVRGDYEIGRIVLHEVPGVGGELVFEMADKPPGAVQRNPGVAPEANSQQMVESGEVIHVGVRDEDIAHPHKLS